MKNFFVTIPHSGEEIPDEIYWLKDLPETTVMRDVDRFVLDLYKPTLEKLNIDYIYTPWHRYFCDLNRVPEDVDCNSVENHPNPAGTHDRGFHWVKTTLEETLMPQPISLKLHQKIVNNYYEPFHVNICKHCDNLIQQGAQELYHLDLHSMPSVGTNLHRDPGERRADVVISDQEGKSAKPEFTKCVQGAFAGQGLKVAMNWPYVGGRITERYGQPEKAHHTVQVELNRDLYMDENTKQWLPEKAKTLQEKLAIALEQITEKVANWP